MFIQTIYGLKLIRDEEEFLPLDTISFTYFYSRKIKNLTKYARIEMG